MKQGKKKNWLLCLAIALCCCLVLAGCGNKEDDYDPFSDTGLTSVGQIASQENAIVIDVYIPKGFGTQSNYVAEAEGKTALELLVDLGHATNTPIVYTGNDATPGSEYVESIDDIAQLDQGPESGWVYFINGELATVGAGQYRPQAGDVISWRYITSYSQLEEFQNNGDSENNGDNSETEPEGEGEGENNQTPEPEQEN